MVFPTSRKHGPSSLLPSTSTRQIRNYGGRPTSVPMPTMPSITPRADASMLLALTGTPPPLHSRFLARRKASTISTLSTAESWSKARLACIILALSMNASRGSSKSLPRTFSSKCLIMSEPCFSIIISRSFALSSNSSWLMTSRTDLRMASMSTSASSIRAIRMPLSMPPRKHTSPHG